MNLSQGLAYLTTQRMALDGFAGVYTDANGAVQTQAFEGRKLLKQADSQGRLRMILTERDVFLPAIALTVNGQTVAAIPKPTPGATWVDSFGTWAVTAPSPGEQCYTMSGNLSDLYRVHVKKVG